MASKKKFIDPKGDWKKDSTGGKVLLVLGGLSAASFAIGLFKTVTNKV